MTYVLVNAMPVLSLAILRRTEIKSTDAAASAAAATAAPAATTTAGGENSNVVFLAAAHNLSSFGWFTRSR